MRWDYDWWGEVLNWNNVRLGDYIFAEMRKTLEVDEVDMFAEDDEGEVMDEEEMYIEAQQKLEQEKESIMANQNMIAEVRKY